ncbi:MAG: TIM barrel protein [Chloroflexi bacterium]|nr:TIM barrel protein [Chloroflexota bacterium]
MVCFGPAGTPHSARSASTVEGVKRVAELGLGCMEVEFVRRVGMGAATAAAVRQEATREGIHLSAHGPYAINLNSHEPDKVLASRQRILTTARVGALCGVTNVVFHAAFYLDDPPAAVYDRVKKHLEEIVQELRAEGNQLTLRPEVMGKHTQFGTLEELLRLSTEVEGLAPCIDIAHWHARTGRFNSYDEFMAMLHQVEEALGRTGAENLHCHVSGIRYGRGGEIAHLNFKDSDFRYREFVRALKDYGAGGVVICESPNLEEDALLLHQEYQALS